MKLKADIRFLPHCASVATDEGLFLAGIAKKELAGKKKPVIVEIGSLVGISACWLMFGAPASTHIYCVDAWTLLAGIDNHYSLDVHEQTFKANVKACGLTRKVTAIKAFSADSAKEWEKPIDILHIDGDHTSMGIYADIANWEPFLKPGGIIVLHDYKSIKHVTEAVDDLIVPTFEKIGQVGRSVAFRKV